jgi:hypothetical protein
MKKIKIRKFSVAAAVKLNIPESTFASDFLLPLTNQL